MGTEICNFATKAEPLRLPYETRSPDTARRVILSRIIEGLCDSVKVRAIVFSVEGLRRHVVVCYGKKIDVVIEHFKVLDEMSGLRHRVAAPVLVINGCRIRFRWRRSRFVLTIDEVKMCNKCRELDEL